MSNAVTTVRFSSLRFFFFPLYPCPGSRLVVNENLGVDITWAADLIWPKWYSKQNSSWRLVWHQSDCGRWRVISFASLLSLFCFVFFLPISFIYYTMFILHISFFLFCSCCSFHEQLCDFQLFTRVNPLQHKNILLCFFS